MTALGKGHRRAYLENKTRKRIAANLAILITSSDLGDSAGEGQSITGDSELLLFLLLQSLTEGSSVAFDLTSPRSEKWLFLNTELFYFSITSHSCG